MCEGQRQYEAWLLAHAPLQESRDIDPDEPANMVVFFAFEWTHADPQSSRSKNVAPQNISDISFTLDTSHFVRSPLKDVAPRNMPRMFSTRETSHFEMSLSKAFALEKMRLMSMTCDTSHAPIGPCGPSKQLPLGDRLRHETTALLSCNRDIGENAGVWGHRNRSEFYQIRECKHPSLNERKTVLGSCKCVSEM